MHLNTAMKCAVRAHRGQTDKSGIDYIKHPGRVAVRVAALGEVFEMVAWLHDVIEDTGFFKVNKTNIEYCAIDLEEKYEFQTNLADALVAITRFDHESYWQYIHRLSENFIARVVKIADLLDNLSPERLDQFPERERNSLKKRYTQTLEYLLEER